VWWQSISGGFKTPWLAVRAVLAIPRAIHELIWGLFFINILGLDPLVAILAIAIPFGAITAKVFSEILDETPRQPLIALLSIGASPLSAFTYSLLPQAFPNLLSYSFYRFECSIRSAAVLGIIGAGGLGYEILLSLQSLRYEQMWTFLIALILLSGITDLWSGLVRRRLGEESKGRLKQQNFLSKPPVLKSGASNTDISKTQRYPISFQLFSTPPAPSAPPARPPLLLLGFGVVIVLFSFWYVQADYSKLFAPRTAQLLGGILKDIFPPDISQLSQLFALSAQTLAMSILAMVFAGLGGILLSLPAASNFLLPGGMFDSSPSNRWWGMVVLLLTRLLLLVARAVPEPIWALIFLFVLFPGILPGALALGLHNLGIIGRLMAEVTENLDERPLRSLKALGASGSQVFLYSVLPRTLPRFIAYTLYRWEDCIRATVVVGLVGAGGLGRLLTEQLSSFDFKSVVTTLIVFIGLTFLVDLISASLRQALR
jgi:phosphonate transport system permease protein